MADSITAGEILRDWAVKPTEERDWDAEIKLRVAFLQDTLRSAGRVSLVLGISGGVDSLVAGRLCQMAAEGLREQGVDARFIAVRLPYGAQADEADAQAALGFISPDETDLVDIKPSVDALHAAVISGRGTNLTPGQQDFERGNVKARIRMTAQYEIAALNGGLVVGTDHNAEGVTGFFTKFGDGACDLLPLRGLSKRQVRLLAKALGAEDRLFNKPATADLESLRPQLTDEEALGISYDVIDDFLEGKPVSDTDAEKIRAQFLKTQHKRRDQPAAMGPYSPEAASAA